jgi:mRNA interferase RelE/StbE
MTYTVDSTETFEKEFSKHHKDKKEWLQRTIERLEQNPEFGKPLRGRLYGIWQLRMDPFRVWYEIDDKNKKVTLKAILHKKEAERHY